MREKYEHYELARKRLLTSVELQMSNNREKAGI